jgi:hypothetical protein
MDLTSEDWLKLLQLGAAGMGATSALGSAAGAVPTGASMSGADLGGNLSAGTLAPPEGFGGAGIPGQTPTPWSPTDNLGLPGAGQGPPAPIPTPAAATPAVRNVGSPAVPPNAAPVTPATPATPTDPYTQTPLTADAVNATTASSDPRSWWQRNISDPWDKANVVDPKTGLSPAQKAMAGLGSAAGGSATKAAAGSSSSAPLQPGSVYKPTPINAAQMALTREQQLELLRKRSRTAMPWLNRLGQQQGLMG